MLPPTSKKPSQLRESSITSELMQDREGSASVSIDNDSRVSVFSPEATPVTPTSSSGSPSNSATFTNGTNKSGSVKPKPGAAKGKPAKSGTPSRPPPPAAVHKLPDASSYLMGEFWLTVNVFVTNLMIQAMRGMRLDLRLIVKVIEYSSIVL